MVLFDVSLLLLLVCLFLYVAAVGFLWCLLLPLVCLLFLWLVALAVGVV